MLAKLRITSDPVDPATGSSITDPPPAATNMSARAARADARTSSTGLWALKVTKRTAFADAYDRQLARPFAPSSHVRRMQLERLPL